MKDYLNKNKKNNLIRLRLGTPSGVDAFITNDIQCCIKLNLKALCEWIYITDNETNLR